MDVDGRRIGYVANMAHHIDVGGSSPASLGGNKEIFQEGLIIPPTRVAVGGRIDENVLNLILANIRAPHETNGDLRAQMSANFVGNRRMAALLERYPVETVEAFFNELIAYTERWTDREVRTLPEGVYEAEDFRDDDGFTDKPVRLKVKVTIKGSHVRLDISGSSEQRTGPLNCNRAMAKTANRIRHAVPSRRPHPGQRGLSKAAARRRPRRYGLHCRPTRRGGRRLGAEPAPNRGGVPRPAPGAARPHPPGGQDIIVNIGFGGHDPKRNEDYCYKETIAGGNGARPVKDGPDAVQTNLQNTENAPIEEVELNYPIRVARLRLFPDSGRCGQVSRRARRAARF